jgi:hypothetical protein
MATLFTHHRQIAPDVTKSRHADFAAEGASDLLLDFDHPQIPFRLIIREGDGQIVQKRQHLVCASQQVVQPLEMVDKSITPCEPISSRFFRQWAVRTGHLTME